MPGGTGTNLGVVCSINSSRGRCVYTVALAVTVLEPPLHATPTSLLPSSLLGTKLLLLLLPYSIRCLEQSIYQSRRMIKKAIH